MTRDEAHLKQVANEICSNVRNCEMIMKSPFTLAKNIDEIGELTSNPKPFYARPQ